MEKFWDWMNEKEYGRKFGAIGYNKIYSNDYYGEPVDPTNQMLIGYMLEYISEHEQWKKKTTPFFEGDLCGIELRLSLIWGAVNPYEELKSIIELLNRED